MYMSLKRSLLHFLETIHPGRYRRMSEKLLLHAVHLYFFVLGISLVLFIILGIGTTMSKADSFADRLAPMEGVSIDFTGSIEGQHELVTRPKVVVDTNKTDAKGAKVVFGSDRIYYKKYYFFGKDEILYEDIESFSQWSQSLRNAVAIEVALMIPGLALAAGIIATIFSLLITSFSSLIAFMVTRRSKMSFRTIWMTSIHAILIPLFITIVALPWLSLWWLALALYLMLFITALSLQKGHTFKSFTY